MHFITFLLKNLLRRKARTLLTCLGIGAAVGTTIALLGISDNFRRETQSGFTSRGIDIVVVENSLDQLTSDLPEDLISHIVGIEGVAAADGALIDIVSYDHEGTVLTLPLQGWKPEGFLLGTVELVEGRKIEPGDMSQMILGKILAQELLKKEVGETLTLDGQEFEIVGIFNSNALQENRCAIANLPKVQQMLYREKRITGISLRVDDDHATEEGIREVCERINNTKDMASEPLELLAQPTNDYVGNSMHIQMAQSMAWMTSIIAIIVGAIGMLNTMVMSVVERVKEISILRAIGWKKNRIVRMIVGESVLLTIGGTIVGGVGASLMVWWLVQWPQVSGYLSADIPWTAYAKGIGLALLIGVVGGIYPAIRASFLMPSEGLRHE